MVMGMTIMNSIERYNVVRELLAQNKRTKQQLEDIITQLEELAVHEQKEALSGAVDNYNINRYRFVNNE